MLDRISQSYTMLLVIGVLLALGICSVSISENIFLFVPEVYSYVHAESVVYKIHLSLTRLQVAWNCFQRGLTNHEVHQLTEACSRSLLTYLQ